MQSITHEHEDTKDYKIINKKGEKMKNRLSIFLMSMALLSYTFGTYTAAAPGGDDDEQNAPTGNPLLDAIRASKNKKRSTLKTGATGTSSDGAATNPGPQPTQPAAAAAGPQSRPRQQDSLVSDLHKGVVLRHVERNEKSALRFEPVFQNLANAVAASGIDSTATETSNEETTDFDDEAPVQASIAHLSPSSLSVTAQPTPQKQEHPLFDRLRNELNALTEEWQRLKLLAESKGERSPESIAASQAEKAVKEKKAEINSAREVKDPEAIAFIALNHAIKNGYATEEQKAAYLQKQAIGKTFSEYAKKIRAAMENDEDDDDDDDDDWSDDDTPAASASAPKQGALQAASTFKKPATAVTSIGASDFAAAAQANPIGKVGTSKPIPGPKPPLPSTRPRKPTPAQQAEFISWVLDFLAGQYQGHLSSIAANIQTDEIAEIVFRFLQNENLSTAPEVIAGIQQEMLNQLTTYIPPVLQPFTAPVAVSAGRVGVPKSDEEVLQDYIYDNMIVATQQLNESSFDEIMDTLQQEAANGTFGALVLDEITARNAIAQALLPKPTTK